MTLTMSAREYAEYSGTDLAALEDAIEEARSDAISRDTMDASTIRTQNFTVETESRMRRFVEAARTADGPTALID